MTEFEKAKEWFGKRLYMEQSGLSEADWEKGYWALRNSYIEDVWDVLLMMHGEAKTRRLMIESYRDWRKLNPTELEQAKKWLVKEVYKQTIDENIDSFDPRDIEDKLSTSEIHIDDIWAALVTVLGEGKAEERLLDRYRDEVKHE